MRIHEVLLTETESIEIMKDWCAEITPLKHLRDSGILVVQKTIAHSRCLMIQNRTFGILTCTQGCRKRYGYEV